VLILRTKIIVLTPKKEEIVHIPINEENDLDIFYWIQKLHNNPYLKKGMLSPDL
jgi:hypothetical protein